MNNTVFDDKEFWKKISINNYDNDNDDNYNNNIPKKSLCRSQNLNYINNEIRIKNDESKSDDDQDDKNNKNGKDININTDDYRIESDHRLNFNFNKRNKSIDINRNIIDKNKK